MYVLEVIPLARAAPAGALSYRSSAKVPVGTLVSVPLRRRNVSGLVVDCVPVREAKARLKAASFSLSKSTHAKQGTLPGALIEAAREVAAYHATTLGPVLSALLVPVLFEGARIRFEKGSAGKKAAGEEMLERVEAPLRTRAAHYEKYLQGETLRKKESGGKGGTTLLVVPTQVEADEWSELLKKYAPVVVSGRLSGKRREAALARAPGARGLVITTPGFAWVPIEQLDRIIIERASAGSYSLAKRPYLDVRRALAALARSRGVALTYGDYPLPLEYRAATTRQLPPTVGVAANSFEVIDVRMPKSPEGSTGKNRAHDTHAPWQAVPDTFRGEIKKVVASGGRVAVLAVRRGYAPTVVCADCGTAVTDGRGRALSLASVGDVRVFRSADGSVIESADAFCKVCGGWNLKPLGIGIERVEEELRGAFPDAPIIRVSEESHRTASLKKAREEIEKPGTIVLGTEMMLPWLSVFAPVRLGIIASADSLLALPFWRSRERFVRISWMLAERAERTFVATRRPEDAALSAVSHPGDATFWQEETLLRKTLSYPPFGTLVVFHIEGSADRLAFLREAVKAACAPSIPHELDARPVSGTTLRASLVLHLPKGAWPDEALSDRFAHLPPGVRIHIDSEMLW